MRPDLQAYRSLSRDLVTRDRQTSEIQQHDLEEDYSLSLASLMSNQQRALELVSEQQENMRRDLVVTCEREVQALKSTNQLQVQRLKQDIDLQRSRADKEKQEKRALQIESLKSIDNLHKTQLITLKNAMEESLEERKIDEKRKRDEELAKYRRELQSQIDFQVEEIEKRLKIDSEIAIQQRKNELETELTELQTEKRRFLVENKQEIEPEKRINAVIGTQTDDFFVPKAENTHQTALKALEKGVIEHLSSLETALLGLISGFQTRVIFLEGRLFRLTRWRSELSEMSKELDKTNSLR